MPLDSFVPGSGPGQALSLCKDGLGPRPRGDDELCTGLLLRTSRDTWRTSENPDLEDNCHWV